MNDKKEQDKNDFLKRLSAMSEEELNLLIKEKGKKPKLVKPLIRLTESNN